MLALRGLALLQSPEVLSYHTAFSLSTQAISGIRSWLALIYSGCAGLTSEIIFQDLLAALRPCEPLNLVEEIPDPSILLEFPLAVSRKSPVSQARSNDDACAEGLTPADYTDAELAINEGIEASFH